MPQAGCPHQCVFCNQRAITGERKARPQINELTEFISTFLTYKHRNAQDVQLSFYGGNFLGLPKKDLIQLLELAQSFVIKKKVDSIRCSTRPDTISLSRLQLLENYDIKTIEIGVQSMDNNVLNLSQRGHTSETTIQATKLLKSSGYIVGHQLMLGLPGETEHSFKQTVRQIIDMQPDFVRLYPTVVLKGSLLADWYTSGRYHPLSLEKAVALAKKALMLFQANNIPIIRMGLHSQENLKENILTGPFHPSFGHMVYSEQMLDKVCEKINASQSNMISILANEKDMSVLTGIKQTNIKKIRSKFPDKQISIVSDPGIKNICIFEHLMSKGG